MTIEITGFSIADGVVTISAVDCSEENLQRFERLRDDGFERELEFVFDTTERKPLNDLYIWLKRQKAVKEAHPQNWKQALESVIGTITEISGRYMELDY